MPKSNVAEASATAALPKIKRNLDWTNTIFLAVAHVCAVLAVMYLAAVEFNWWTVGLGLVWFALCGFSITGGYHRLFAHRTYTASNLVKAFYLVFGAASAQNSALEWSGDHRRHHTRTDTDDDPYNIQRGFWWAHIGWIFFKADRDDEATVKDLSADPLIRFQHKHYVALAVIFGALLPAGLGLLWGDPLGALLVAGFLRLVVQWHSTFTVNSFGHYVGSRPYSLTSSARDSLATALLSLGEGYHNFHHRFQADYRNGVRWFHIDPTKWAIWSLSLAGLTSDLRRTPKRLIQRAREEVQAQLRTTKLTKAPR